MVRYDPLLPGAESYAGSETERVVAFSCFSGYRRGASEVAVLGESPGSWHMYERTVQSLARSIARDLDALTYNRKHSAG